MLPQRALHGAAQGRRPPCPLSLRPAFHEYDQSSLSSWRYPSDQVFDDGDAVTSGLPDLFTRKTAHLSPAHAEYLRHWDELINLEQGDIHRFRKEIWCMLAGERERQGPCLSDMVIDMAGTGDADQAPGAFGGYVYRFRFVLVGSTVL